MTLASRIADLASRIASEFKTLRSDVAARATAAYPIFSGNAEIRNGEYPAGFTIHNPGLAAEGHGGYWGIAALNIMTRSGADNNLGMGNAGARGWSLGARGLSNTYDGGSFMFTYWNGATWTEAFKISPTGQSQFISRPTFNGATPWDNYNFNPADYAPVGHSHAYADITGKPATFAPSAHTHLWGDITDKPTTFTPATHVHAAGDVTTGTFALARLPVATSGQSNATQVVRADDSRLSNARTPTAHTHLWGDITDKPTTFAPTAHRHGWADLDNVPTSFTPAAHAHDTSAITSGTFGLERLPVAASGTLSATMIVRADDSRLSNARTPLPHQHPWSDITGAPASYPPDAHNHDDRYYTETEIDAKLAGISGGSGSTSTTYTNSQLDTKFANKADLDGPNTFVGNQTFEKTDASGLQLYMQRLAGEVGYFTFRTGTSNRWLFGVNSASESGGNAGSDFVLNRYDDAGVLIDSAIRVRRNTGVAELIARPTFAGNTPWDSGNYVPKYDISLFVVDKPAAGEILLRHFPATAFTIPAGMSGSQGYAPNPASGSAAAFNLSKNGSSVGTISFAVGATAPTFTMASATTFNPGDMLAISAPATQNAGLANISLTISGLR